MNEGMDAYRQEGGAVDLAEVAQHEAALQDSITLANQAASGDRFTKSQLEQASTPLQVSCWRIYPCFAQSIKQF